MSSTEKAEQPKQYWWLVAGEVFFHPVGKPESINMSMASAVMGTVAPVVNAEALNKAQRGLMQNIANRTAESGQQIPVQVTVTAISALGLMSEEEFYGKKVG